MVARLAIGTRGHDQAMQPLHRPAVLDEVGGQPVQQLGMRGLGSLGPEVVGVPGDRQHEMMLPDPVDDRAGRQRVARIRDPSRKSEPTALKVIGQEVGVARGVVGDGHSGALSTPGPTGSPGASSDPARVDGALGAPLRVGIAPDAEVASVVPGVVEVGAVVDALRQGLVAFQTPLPDPFVLLADLELSLVDVVEADVPGRLLLVGELLAGGLGDVFEVVLLDTSPARRPPASSRSSSSRRPRRRASAQRTVSRRRTRPGFPRRGTARAARPSACPRRRRTSGSSRGSGSGRTCGRDTSGSASWSRGTSGRRS